VIVLAGGSAPGTPSLISPADRATVARPVTFDRSDEPDAAAYL